MKVGDRGQRSEMWWDSLGGGSACCFVGRARMCIGVGKGGGG